MRLLYAQQSYMVLRLVPSFSRSVNWNIERKVLHKKLGRKRVGNEWMTNKEFLDIYTKLDIPSITASSGPNMRQRDVKYQPKRKLQTAKQRKLVEVMAGYKGRAFN